MEGHISCVSGQCLITKDYDKHLKEFFNPDSTAKFVQIAGKSYAVGALARINNNLKFLSKDAKKIITSNKIKFPNYNPFFNNFAQAVETVHLFDRCIEILTKLKLKEEPLPKIKPKAGRGIGVLEAPRGILFHDYTFNKKGEVVKANIITPTSQNLMNIENDIKDFLPGLLKYKKPRIALELEKLIRAYDPCISCSTHFLEVKWE
jgi:coenzyme F420-reducing hydrogenase alpha subunit